MISAGDDGVSVDGTVEITGFVTYAGAGFALVRTAPERGEQSSPTPASSRRYLRGGLPALYQQEDFGMRLVAALEGVLDPVVAVLDSLPAHFDAELAPIDILRSACSINAEILNQSGKLGVIREGALADLLVVDGNPLEDIGLLADGGASLVVIMKDGQVHKRTI